MPRLVLPLLAALALVLLILSVSSTTSPLSPAGSPSSSSSAGTVVPAPMFFVSKPYQGPTCDPNDLCPSLLNKGYGFDQLHSKGITGKGQTVVIDDACGDPTIANDLKTFDQQFKLPNPTLTIYYPQGKRNLCVDSGWSVETSLDVEWAHAVAPGAAIALLVANQPSVYDMYNAWNFSLSHKLGNEISNSYGGAGCGGHGCNNTEGQGIGPCTTVAHVHVAGILSNAAAAHVTVLAASGDGGAWGKGTSAVQPVPGDCAGVLTVGGTILIVDSSGKWAGEIGWSGSGGGYTTLAEPSYQKKVGIPDQYKTLAKPDVAANAATAVWIYNQGWGEVGGTSLACPLWAGFMADVNQIRSGNGFKPAGFVNPFLYTAIYAVKGGSSLYRADFHDITSGNNGWPAAKGWDAVTGLGTFKAPALAMTLGYNKTA
jgi:subtilase family serine protease